MINQLISAEGRRYPRGTSKHIEEVLQFSTVNNNVPHFVANELDYGDGWVVLPTGGGEVTVDTGGGFGGGGGTFSPSAASPTFTGAPLSAYSPAMQAAILRREELKAETARLRAQREANAEARVTVNMGVVGDPESAARTIIDVVNKSQQRGTLGAGAFLTV